MFYFKLAIIVITGAYIIYTDLKSHLIYNWVNALIFISGLVTMVWSGNYISHLLGSLLLGTALLLLAVVTKGFGLGDVKYLYASGMLLGLKTASYGLVIGIILGGIVSGLLLITKKVDRKTFIAYGPYLVIGNLLALLFY
jgi:prepilin signal peptidase PulO-like enzyme (type II secretory pathway)